MGTNSAPPGPPLTKRQKDTERKRLKQAADREKAQAMFDAQTLAEERNKKFQAEMHKKTGTTACGFSAIGWDAKAISDTPEDQAKDQEYFHNNPDVPSIGLQVFLLP